MIKQLIILFYILIGALTPSISIALVIGSDQEEIYIDANFSGEELLVFGAFYSDPSQSRDSKSDILIEVVGPPEDVALRKKDSYFGFWLNSKSVTFRDVPGFYYLSSTSDLTSEFLMNNQMRNFSHFYGRDDMQYGISEANKLEPGKRMISTQTPTLVFNPNGDLFYVF